jgi:general secretion pathway protein G
MRKNPGFTLMELLISISIIGILVAIGIVSFATVNRQSRDTKRKSDIEQVRSALEMYRADNGNYPSTGGGSYVDVSTLAADLEPDYIANLPSDPLATQAYMYIATNGSGGTYYGYCISTLLEAEDPVDSCTPDTGHNFGSKHP